MKSAFLLLPLLALSAQTAMAQVAVYPPTYPARHRAAARTPTTPAYTPVVLTPAEKAAKAVIDRMAAALNRAEGIEFNADITYSVEKNGAVTSTETHALTTLERTAKLLIQSTDAQGDPDGGLCADGSVFTLYDAVGKRYINVTISPDVYSMQQALALSGQQVFTHLSQSAKDMSSAIGFPMIFFNQVYDASSVEAGETLSFSSTNSTSADGKPVILATETLTSERRGSLAVTYMVDTATNLPLQFSQIETRPGEKPITDLQESFNNLSVLRSPLPDSTYHLTIPTSATLVTQAP